MQTSLVARFDGGCWPNPNGPAASACLIMRGEEEVYRAVRYLGSVGTSNNFAEFHGLKMVLGWLQKTKTEEPVLIISDSKFLIAEMGRMTLRYTDKLYAPVMNSCIEMIQSMSNMIIFEWQDRSHNEECDAMCVLAMEEADLPNRPICGWWRGTLPDPVYRSAYREKRRSKSKRAARKRAKQAKWEAGRFRHRPVQSSLSNRTGIIAVNPPPEHASKIQPGAFPSSGSVAYERASLVPQNSLHTSGTASKSSARRFA